MNFKVHTHELQSSPHELQSSPHELKNNPIKNNPLRIERGDENKKRHFNS
jgi:hypothetical protein